MQKNQDKICSTGGQAVNCLEEAPEKQDPRAGGGKSRIPGTGTIYCELKAVCTAAC